MLMDKNNQIKSMGSCSGQLTVRCAGRIVSMQGTYFAPQNMMGTMEHVVERVTNISAQRMITFAQLMLLLIL